MTREMAMREINKWRTNMATRERETGTKDEHYNLVSVLYHALQGAETYAQYIRDAEQAGDRELVQFLQEVKTEEERRAERAKALLRQRLGQGSSRA
jgi:hypothetical protein